MSQNDNLYFSLFSASRRKIELQEQFCGTQYQVTKVTRDDNHNNDIIEEYLWRVKIKCYVIHDVRGHFPLVP